MKEQIVAVMRAGDYDDLVDAVRARRISWSQLIRVLYIQDDVLAWRAVRVLGRAVGVLASTDKEACREILRRLLWALNDESGTSGPLVAPAVGEAVASAPDVLGEYATLLLPSLEEPYLQAGVAWAYGRIGQVRPELARDAVLLLFSLLSSSDPGVRGHAIWALGEICGRQPVARGDRAKPIPVCKAIARQLQMQMTSLVQDSGAVRIFLEGNIIDTTVGALATRALPSVDNHSRME